MDAAKEGADSAAGEKNSRKKGKVAKERDAEATTATPKDTTKRGKKEASKKRPGTQSRKDLTSAVEGPLPETTAAEHTAMQTPAVQGQLRTDTTQGAHTSKATGSKHRDKYGGDKRKGRGVVTSSQERPLPTSAVGGPSLQPDVGGSQEARVTPVGQTTQSPVGIDNKNADDPRTYHQAADRRKPSAAALSTLVGKAEMSGCLSPEIIGQAVVTVSVIQSPAAPDAASSSFASPASATSVAGTHGVAGAKIWSPTDGASTGTSKLADSGHTDMAARSERRRSTLVKTHSAIMERALRDRRGSTMPEKSWIPNRSCVLVCMVAFVSGTLLLMLALYKVPEILKSTACETPACVRFARRMQETLNASVDPCRDFAQFVCGGWGKTHDLAVADEALVDALLTIGNRLSDVRVPTAEKQDAKLKAHLLYRSCHSVLKGERDELDNVRKALLEVGVVWPHTSPEPNVLSTLLRSSLALHWGAPFDVTLQQGAMGELVVVLQPFRLFDLIRDKFIKGSGDGQRREAYFETLRSSFRKSDAGLVDFDTVNGLDEDAFSAFPEKVNSFPDPVTLDSEIAFEGVEYVTEALWREALSPYTPVKNPSNITVKTYSEAFLHKFRELWTKWAKYGKQKMHIFVSWCIVQIAALYANQKLQLNFYRTENKAVLVQGSSCLARAFLIGRTEVFAGYGDDLLASRSRFLAYKLMLTVRKAFERILRRWKGFDANVTVLRRHGGAEGSLHVLHAGFLPAGDDTAPDMQDSLVHNWRNAPVPAMEAGPLRDVHTTIEAGKLLLMQEEDFMLMPYAFAVPYFDEGFTGALNYAGVGGIASFAMANLFYEAYREPSGVNSSLQDTLNCMRNFYADAQDESVVNRLMLRVLAVQTSSDAYERHFSLQDIPISGLESFSPQQMFFIASCYVLCTGGHQSAASAQCNEHLQHVYKFASAFSCAQNSPMNPPIKCGLM